MNTKERSIELAKKGQTGLVHIYCGDGKGKTTTGMGLCLRAAGSGLKVLIYQFMKDNRTSERRVLEALDNVTFIDGLDREKFSLRLTSEEKAQRRAFYNSRLTEVTEKAVSEAYDVLFLDEAIYAIRAGLLDESLLTGFLGTKPAKLEVILTGQKPGEKLLALADYVSEIRKIKHPYDLGVPARPGIER